MIRTLASLVLAMVLAWHAYPTASEPERFEAVESHMGTLVRITVYAPDIEAARKAIRVGFERIRVLDGTLSDYKPDSELRRLTSTAVGRPVPVSADLFSVLAASQELAEATDGAFDVTQGPVVRLWREARKVGKVPAPDVLVAATARSGFRKLVLDADARTVRLVVPGMALDVGAIGKGYAASEALEAITASGISSALVAVSGDLAFSAAPPGRTGWRIGVHSYGPEITSVPQTLELTHAAVSTSGNAAQHLDVDGRRYSHIIDPGTGVGLVDDINVTVIAPHGLHADGLDTAVSVLGAARGLALIEARPDTAALVIERTRDGVVTARASAHLLRIAGAASSAARRVRHGQAQPPF